MEICPEIIRLQLIFGHWMPGVVVLYMTVVGVMGPVRYSPSVVGYKNGGVDDVANKVVEGSVVGERLVPAVMSDHKEGPEHGALGKPIEGPKPPVG